MKLGIGKVVEFIGGGVTTYTLASQAAPWLGTLLGSSAAGTLGAWSAKEAGGLFAPIMMPVSNGFTALAGGISSAALGLGATAAVASTITAVAMVAVGVCAIWAVSKLFKKIGNAIDQKIDAAKAAREQQQGERAPQQEMGGPAQGQGHSQQQGQGKHVPMHQRGEQVDYTKYEGHPANNTPEGFHQKRYLEQGGRAPVQPGMPSAAG